VPIGVVRTYGPLETELLAHIVGASILAGLAAGILTIWTRSRAEGAETAFGILATYFGGAAVMCVSPYLLLAIEAFFTDGRFYFMDLRSITGEAVGVLILGLLLALPFGVVLVPLCYLSRRVVWKLYTAPH
jgi:hypothetical protein